MTFPASLAKILTHEGHESIKMLQMVEVWGKLKKAIPALNPTLDSVGLAIQSLSTAEKATLVNVLSLTRKLYTQFTGFTALASPILALCKHPVPTHLSQEELKAYHIELRQRMSQYGKAAVYMIYPSISIALYAEAALETDWPYFPIEKDKEENPIAGLAYEYHCFGKDTGDSVHYRLRTCLLKAETDINKGLVAGHGVQHPFFHKLVKNLNMPVKEAPRAFYQGNILFCRQEAKGMYDINNVVSLRSPIISGYGVELLSKAQIQKEMDEL